MAYGYNYGGYQPGYPGGYMPPVPDQLAQLRQNQMQQQAIQPIQTQAQQMQAQQPMMTQPLMQPLQTTTAAQNGSVDDRIWVQGEGAATSYLMAPNGFVRLWDSTAPVFYEKQADGQGKPLPLRIFDYVERTASPKTSPVIPQVEYVTIDKYNALVKRLDALENKPCKCAEKRKVKEEIENAQSDL